QELAANGARVLNAQAVEFAKQKGIAIYARKTGSTDPGTVIRRDVPKATTGVRGIAHETRVATIAAASVTAADVRRVLEVMEEVGAHGKQIVHTETGAFSAVFSLDDVHREASLERTVTAILGPGSYRADKGAVSLIGEGIARTSSLAV